MGAQAEAASASKDSEAPKEAVKPDNDTPANQNGSNGDKIESIDNNDKDNDEGTDDNEGSTKGGLTSEERVLLREKKKARLQKEQADQLSQETCQNNQELNFGGQKGDEGHSESGAEGSATEGDEGTEGGSARGRLTRSGRRKG